MVDYNLLPITVTTPTKLSEDGVLGARVPTGTQTRDPGVQCPEPYRLFYISKAPPHLEQAHFEPEDSKPVAA